jgi:hypothetical protein
MRILTPTCDRHTIFQTMSFLIHLTTTERRRRFQSKPIRSAESPQEPSFSSRTRFFEWERSSLSIDRSLENDHHSLKSDQHTPTSDQHPLKSDQHSPESDQHPLKSVDHSLNSNQHSLESDQHALTSVQHTPESDQHSSTSVDH